MAAPVNINSARRYLLGFAAQLAVACARRSGLWPPTAGDYGRLCARPIKAARMFKPALKHRVALRNDTGLVQTNQDHRQRFYWHPDQPLQPDRYLEVAAIRLLPFRPSEDGIFAAGLDHRPDFGSLAARYRQYLSENLPLIGFVRILTP
ncbi:hypothetical protein [Pseudomonas corrugata]|uniref:hypothetical protein n=1 Tax=Pseudomonas corrugata TaxID=47879 RepID=UPI00128FA4F1|nr:hypothetical protein [Pseudomonas corrugata]